MTYADAISLVEREVRDKLAWPSDDSKLQEQIDMLHVAAIAVGCDVPLQRLSLEESDLEGTPVQKIPVKFNGTYTEVDGTLTAEVMASPLQTYDLPSTIFKEREDMGISHLQVNGALFDFSEFLSVNSIKNSANNSFQRNEVLVGADLRHKKFYITNGLDVVLVHAKAFEKPEAVSTGEDGSYEDAEYPFSGKDAQRCVQLVAAHISGVQIRDSAAAQFHALLTNTYKGQYNA